MTHWHEGSFSTFPWRFLHVVKRGIKSWVMRPSTLLRDFMLAAFLRECLLLERRTQRGISELRSACSYFFPNLGFAVSWGLFPAKGLATTHQQSLLWT